jgi:hypothetical protein
MWCDEMDGMEWDRVRWGVDGGCMGLDGTGWDGDVTWFGNGNVGRMVSWCRLRDDFDGTGYLGRGSVESFIAQVI